jgi:hypothetical protein
MWDTFKDLQPDPNDPLACVAQGNPVFPQIPTRNFVQDDGSTVGSGYCAGLNCQPEVTIPRCDCVSLGCYNLYVKAVYWEDEDGDTFPSCGDTIFQVEKSDPLNFCVTNEPHIYKLSPRTIDCSYKCTATSEPDSCATTGIFWNVLRIYGEDFGPARQKQTYDPAPNYWWKDEVRIGLAKWYVTNPLNGTRPSGAPNYIAMEYLRWSNTLIKAAIVLPDTASDRKVYVWVVTNIVRDASGAILSGDVSNALPLQLGTCDRVRP